MSDDRRPGAGLAAVAALANTRARQRWAAGSEGITRRLGESLQQRMTLADDVDGVRTLRGRKCTRGAGCGSGASLRVSENLETPCHVARAWPSGMQGGVHAGGRLHLQWYIQEMSRSYRIHLRKIDHVFQRERMDVSLHLRIPRCCCKAYPTKRRCLSPREQFNHTYAIH